MKIILMWLSLGATFFPSPQQRPIPADPAIVLAIRIFDGTAEVIALIHAVTSPVNILPQWGERGAQEGATLEIGRKW